VSLSRHALSHIAFSFDSFIPPTSRSPPSRAGLLPWHSHSPCRSMAFVYLAAYPPMLLCRALSFSFQLHPWVLVAAPRLWTLVISLGHDTLVGRLAGLAELPVGPVLAVWAVLWPTLIFQSRTFSNTYELFWLTAAACCAAGVRVGKRQTSGFGAASLGANWVVRAVGFGLCTTFGVFTRVTMLPYAFPFGLLLLADTTLGLHRGIRLDVALMERPPVRSLLVSIVGTMVVVAFTIGLTAIWLIVEDTWYFSAAPYGERGQHIATMWREMVVVAPWNLLWFNADQENVAQFGLHPWWMHTVVNLPFLLGPLVPLLGAQIGWSGVGGMLTRSWECDDRRIRAHPSGRAVLLRLALLCSVVLGVAALSLAAHQEARFLLPTTVGVAVLASPYLWTRGKPIWRVFVGLHLVVALFFSHVHQAGVLPALVTKAVEQDTNHHLLVYGSYMPPRFILGEAVSESVSGTVHDLSTATDAAEFRVQAQTVLQLVYRCNDTRSTNLELVLSLAASESAITPELYDAIADLGLTVAPKARCYWPHFSGVSIVGRRTYVRTVEVEKYAQSLGSFCAFATWCSCPP
jgi:hypothetical protein